MKFLRHCALRAAGAASQLGLATALAVFLAAPAAQVAIASEGPFWRVSGARGTAYLLGSLHFGTQAMYPLSAPVNAGFEQSDRLAVEIDLESLDAAQMARWMAEQGGYRDGTSLPDHVSASTWETLKRRAAEYGAPVELIAYQRPWLAAFTLTALALSRKGFREELGVDRHFISRARKRVPIVELESFDEQLALLSGLSPIQQERFLEATLADLAAGSATFESIVSAWRRGDAAALDEAINAAWRADPEGEVLFEQLIEQRNAAMAEHIAELLERGGTTFVVVGAAHLVGPGGVAARLEARGYRVEQR